MDTLNQFNGSVGVARDAYCGGDAQIKGSLHVGCNVVIDGWLEAPNIKGPNKGFFASLELLERAYPHPRPGWWALVGNAIPADIYRCDQGEWRATGEQGGQVVITEVVANPDYESQMAVIASLSDLVANGIVDPQEMTAAQTPSQASLRYKVRKTGQEDTTVDVALPMASSSGAGMITSDEYASLRQMAHSQEVLGGQVSAFGGALAQETADRQSADLQLSSQISSLSTLTTSQMARKADVYNWLASGSAETPMNRAIADAMVVPRSPDSQIQLRINNYVKNFQLSGRTYNTIYCNVLVNGATAIENLALISVTEGKGRELLSNKANALADIYLLLDWDKLADGNVTVAQALDIGKTRPHCGMIQACIDIGKVQDRVDDIGQSDNGCDQMFLRRGQVVAYNNYMNIGGNGKGTIAKYARVDMGSPIRKCMCRFVYRGGCLLMAVTPNDQYGNISNIVRGAVHPLITHYQVNVGEYTATNVLTDHVVPLSPYLVVGQEYEWGLEFIGDNRIRVYLPNGTTAEVEGQKFDELRGRYLVLEMFNTDCQPLESESVTTEWNCSRFTSLYCECDDGVPLVDNFNRPDGQLGRAPSGHVYQTFRNQNTSDTRYDSTNQGPA